MGAQEELQTTPRSADDAWQSCGEHDGVEGVVVLDHNTLRSAFFIRPGCGRGVCWRRTAKCRMSRDSHHNQLQGLALCDHGILKLVTLAGPAWHSQCTGALRETVGVAQNLITTGNMLQRHFDVTRKQSADISRMSAVPECRSGGTRTTITTGY